MRKFPSSQEILNEAIKINKNADINMLHSLTFDLMKRYRNIYYPLKVDELLSRKTLNELSDDTKEKIKRELLKSIKVDKKIYTNFMEESTRRISQTFQTISGNLAELCVEKILIDLGLEKGVHYKRRVNRSDFIFYFPNSNSASKTHRVEVKNVKLRERAIRGLAFDGDSLFGFFDEASEFSDNTIEIIHAHCKRTQGFCYIPPKLFRTLGRKVKNKRVKSNLKFASDMKRFVEKGTI